MTCTLKIFAQQRAMEGIDHRDVENVSNFQCARAVDELLQRDFNRMLDLDFDGGEAVLSRNCPGL